MSLWLVGVVAWGAGRADAVWMLLCPCGLFPKCDQQLIRGLACVLGELAAALLLCAGWCSALCMEVLWESGWECKSR